METRLSGIFTRLSITLDSTSRFSEPPHTCTAELPNMLMLVGWLAGCLAGCLAVRLAGWLCWLAGWVGWSVAVARR